MGVAGGAIAGVAVATVGAVRVCDEVGLRAVFLCLVEVARAAESGACVGDSST